MADLVTKAALKNNFNAGGANEIAENGQQQITGQRLNTVLNNIVDTMGIGTDNGTGENSVIQKGTGAQALNDSEFAVGSYNKSNKKTTGTADEKAAGSTRYSIGIGTSDADRKNAVEVMQNGDVYVAGVGGYNGKNPNTPGVETFPQVINKKQNKHIQLEAGEFTYISEGEWYDAADGEESSIGAPVEAASIIVSCFVFNPTNSVADIKCYKEAGDFGSDVTTIRLAPLEYIKLTANVDSNHQATWTWKSISGISFTNPVGPWRPDPCFWKGDDGYFYVKGTGRANTVLRTRDFVHYEDTGKTFLTDNAMNALFDLYGHYATDQPTYKLHPHQWAPFVIKIGGNWVMYMAIVERTGTVANPVDGTAHIVALTSRTPYGYFDNPVTIVSDNEVKASASSTTKWNNVIDPFVYCDPYDNKLRLLAGSSYAIRRAYLADDGLSLAEGTYATHAAGQSITTDPTRATVYEGAYIFSRPCNGVMYDYLFVSAGDYASRDYCVKVGRRQRDGMIGGNSPINFVDKSGTTMRTGGGETILSTESADSVFWGPGHIGGIFETADGKTWMLYHCHDGNGANDRKLFIQEVLWDENGWPYMENNGHPIANGVVSKNIITDTPKVTVDLSPLIVTGTITGGGGVALDDPHIQVDDLKNAFDAGRVVLLKYTIDDSGSQYNGVKGAVRMSHYYENDMILFDYMEGLQVCPWLSLI